MNSVFISGSSSIKDLPNDAIKSLENIIDKEFEIFVGDAKGVDTLIQQYFYKKEYTNINICTIYETPRNLASNKFKIKQVDYDKNLFGEREKQTFKDEFMTLNSNYSFAIWDGKSKGSFENIKRAIISNKKLKVFYTLENRFLEKELLDIENITNLYKQNKGYTQTEIYNKIKESKIYININKANEIKKWLIDNDILKIYNDKLSINQKYKNYFIVENYRGNENIKYKANILELFKSNSLFGSF
ncbi:hypothetical protein [Aliarcobacter cryaerophilus]|uniref:hypothetical protein n=1 Tax=Aliarcobacter cryaerophilus TaxID=28198 RepID=UPI003DA5EF2B